MRKLKNWVKALLFWVIVFILLFSFREQITGLFVFDNCQGDEDPGMVLQCYVDKAIEAKDIELCHDERITNDKTVSYCEQEIAILNKDASICENIEHEVWKSPCFRKVAIELNDYELCFKTIYSEDRLNCFLMLL